MSSLWGFQVYYSLQPSYTYIHKIKGDLPYSTSTSNKKMKHMFYFNIIEVAMQPNQQTVLKSQNWFSLEFAKPWGKS